MTTHCCIGFEILGAHTAACDRLVDEALSDLRRRLTGYDEGFGKVTFFRTDGRTVVADNVRYDSIKVDSYTQFVSVEFADESIRHIPFVESWKVDF